MPKFTGVELVAFLSDISKIFKDDSIRYMTIEPDPLDLHRTAVL